MLLAAGPSQAHASQKSKMLPDQGYDNGRNDLDTLNDIWNEMRSILVDTLEPTQKGCIAGDASHEVPS